MFLFWIFWLSQHIMQLLEYPGKVKPFFLILKNKLNLFTDLLTTYNNLPTFIFSSRKSGKKKQLIWYISGLLWTVSRRPVIVAAAQLNSNNSLHNLLSSQPTEKEGAKVISSGLILCLIKLSSSSQESLEVMAKCGEDWTDLIVSDYWQCKAGCKIVTNGSGAGFLSAG